jgi:ribonucrease Y
MEETPSLFFLLFLLGLLCGAAIFFTFNRFKCGSYQKLASDILQKVESEAEKIRNESELERKRKLLDLQKEFEDTWQKERQKIHLEEAHLKQKEDKLENRMNLVEKKLSQIEKREAFLHARKAQVQEEQQIVADQKMALRSQLEEAAGLTASEAKNRLLEQLNDEIKRESATYLRKARKEVEENADREASRILATAINRLAVPCVSEITVNTVTLPNEEMKARIIGREGRNIRALERATGTSFVIDDTPGAVVLSAFDPVRLYIAKQSLTELVLDGRIHPTRIEEVVDRATKSIDKKIKEYGQNAAIRTGQYNLHPEIIQLLGKLKFRYSFGQNVLDHSVEVSYLMGMIAAELHLDVNLAKRIGLLHDMGKAVTHEMQGTHAVIGHDLALKYGESKDVANGIGCHHNEMEPITIEGSFCGAADAISASRPGARIEAVEEYVKRITRLEEIAYEFPGIEKAYAMQAGKELCIVVLPDMIDDPGAINLARDLSKKIEKELQYPGKIKITVIREKRAVQYAV